MPSHGYPESVAQRVWQRPHSLGLPDGRTITFPAVMGILNVTPDSFSDGGQFLEPEKALEHALAMEAEGAAIIDVGGESTRPMGARDVPAEVELKRVLPVLRLLASSVRIPISIDTRKARVAEAALGQGAVIINDVSALSADRDMAMVAVKARCPVVLMHMRGGPENHMQFAQYDSSVEEVTDYLRERAGYAVEAGIDPSRIIIDPGLGFAKLARHSVELLVGLPQICALGYPVLIGASRKGFIRKIAGESTSAIQSGNAVVEALAISNGASIVRVHDVGRAVAAAKMADAIARAMTE